MKRQFTTLLSLTAAAIIATACAATDAGVTTKVKSQLAADDTVKAYQIDVDTKNHVVTLTGTVDSSMAEERALELARQTEGVTSVVDNITVGGSAAPTTGETMDNMGDAARDAGRDMSNAAREAGRDMGDAAQEAGRDIRDAGRDVGAATTDAAVTSAVKAKFLADPDVSGLKIDVDTSNGIVTLTGVVKSQAEKNEALRLARETSGVTRVNDKLTIGH